MSTQRIVVRNGSEPMPAWNSLCKDPTSFLNEIASRLGLEFDILFESVIISEKVPEASDRKKLWVKTSWPYGIGKLIDGRFQMDYGMSGMLPNIPFQASVANFDPPKDFVRKLSDVEMKEFGLFNAADDKAVKRMPWYIFEPQEINY